MAGNENDSTGWENESQSNATIGFVSGKIHSHCVCETFTTNQGGEQGKCTFEKICVKKGGPPCFLQSR